MKCAKEKHAMLEFHTIAKGTKTISKRIQAVGGQPWQAAAPKKFLQLQGSRNQ